MQDAYSDDQPVEPIDASLAGAGLGDAIPFARPVRPEPIPMARRWQHPFLLPDMSRKGAFGDVALCAFLLLGWDAFSWLIVFLGAFGGGAGSPGDPEQVAASGLVPGLALRAAGVVLIVWALVRWRRQPPAAVGIPRSGWVTDILLGTAGVFVVYGLLALVFLVGMVFWPEMQEQMSENVDRLLELVPPLSPLGFWGLALLIGVYEELLFRGFLMGRLRRATGSWLWAVGVSSAVFTILHAWDQEPAALIFIGMLSLTFSMLTVWRRSIVPAIVAHALFDYSQFLIISMQK